MDRLNLFLLKPKKACVVPRRKASAAKIGGLPPPKDKRAYDKYKVPYC